MPTAPRVPSGAKKVPKGLRASKAVKKAPKDLEQLPAPMVAALKLINDLKKKPLDGTSYRLLQGYMWTLRDSKHFSRTQVERILTKARSHALGEADLEVLRTAAPVRSGARPVLALPVAEKNSYEINFATEIAHINTEIDRLGHHADDAGPILCRLDCLSKATTKVFKVVPSPVMYKNIDEKKPKNRPRPLSMMSFSTVDQLIDFPRQDCPITIGLISLWEQKGVGITQAEFLSNDFHANFLMVVHAPNGVNPSPGKALVVGDPNVINTVEGIPNKRMGALVNHARRKLKGSPVFLNRVRPVRNSNGECLQLVLRWILDLILHADEFLKDVKRCSGGKVSSLKGFRNLGMK
ncbi:hypothetical protein B0H14DRAFT_3905756 [Mycena olivaceomarginata]|nr:hypothetical protein B0H14DRAFT_3905756 [Mycena olivaceomarginata]